MNDGETVYLVWWDPDPGYSVTLILGVFATREAADDRLKDADAYDSGVLELTLGAHESLPLAT